MPCTKGSTVAFSFMTGQCTAGKRSDFFAEVASPSALTQAHLFGIVVRATKHNAALSVNN